MSELRDLSNPAVRETIQAASLDSARKSIERMRRYRAELEVDANCNTVEVEDDE